MKNLLKDISSVLSSNIINLIIGIVNGFLIPKFLGINEYAILKTYTLYAGYVGILHFGYIDGLYLKYGGKKIYDINKKQLKEELLFVIKFQAIVTLIILVVSFSIRNWILIAVTLVILPQNLINFFKFIYQATGEFNIFSKINSIVPVLQLLLTLLAVYFIKERNAYIFIGILIFVPMVISIILSRKQFKEFKNVEIVSKEEKSKHFVLIKTGFFVMIGNLAGIPFFTIDRMFVKIVLSLKEFAIYAFAISLLRLLMVFIKSAALIFYPTLTKQQDNSNLIQKLKTIIENIAALLIGSYFLIHFIVEEFLPEFKESLDILPYLFLAVIPMAIIHTIYINLYKASKREKKYSFSVILMVVIATIANTCAIFFFNNSTSIALATVFSFYVWFFYSSKDFCGTKSSFKEIFYLFFINLIFLLLVYFIPNKFMGLLIYETVVIVLTILLYKETIKEFILLLKKLIN